jgi:hypothetical protein
LFGRRTQAAKVLIAAGADVTPKRGGAGWLRAGWTALHYAAGFGFVELAKAFIDRGADPDARDDDGKTPLQVAVETDHAEVAELLRK